ncbi:MAG: transcription termination factor NusA [Kiritimatiellae bacterium]|nr:transcription termination factor NusA [Kiritimatiellia bacterium]
MNGELLAIVSYLERDRGVSREVIIQAIESAIQHSAKCSLDVSKNLRVKIDRKTLQLTATDTVTVSNVESGPGYINLMRARKTYGPDVREGDQFEVSVPTTKLGRIAAQAARQMILQKIREAERKNVMDEFKDRVGDIVSGTVKSIERRDIYIDLGKADALMPAKERMPTEEFQVGDRIRAYVYRVTPNSLGPSIILSRACPDFVKLLFRLEVSEISDGIVEIVSVARDPGLRTKIAVKTLDDKVDPVGACVGLRGARVRNIIKELSGEKIDIVRWSPDIRQFVTQALQPAKLTTVEVAKDSPKTVRVTVAPDQLSLAIGKHGQNVRLTSKLTGYHVSITKTSGQESFAEQRDSAIQHLADSLQTDEATASLLVSNGFLTPDGILASDVPYVCEVTGLDRLTVEGLFAVAQTVLDSRKPIVVPSDE